MNDVNAWLNTLNWQPISDKEFNALSTEEKLFRIRHSSAHVLATAVKRLRPDVNFATGPATSSGFFYDVRTETQIRGEDLPDVQREFDNVVKESQPFEVARVGRGDAQTFFDKTGDRLKLEVLAGIAAEEVTLYRNGNFIDLCAGPHVPNTSYCKHASLLTISASHWRGETIPSLSRITGTAWSNPKDLRLYLNFLEEVKKRDHRVLGPQLDLFSFHPWAAAALWHPNGVRVRSELYTFWREMLDEGDYIEISNPLLYRKELFETSGHWDHYQENMFIFRSDDGKPSFALKPMNCPDTMLFFRSEIRSYRQLPMRVAEGQILHRNEPTGALHGIMRTRNFVQDDAHIFLSEDQIFDEIRTLLAMLERVYQTFGLSYDIHFSTRPEKFMGAAEVWDKAEAGLKAALEKSEKQFVVDEGEGAFYGPKIDFFVKDSLGRSWQCGTVQLDFQLPERFDLKYTAIDGTIQRPIVIHRAVLGSFDRFLGILIEHFSGAFPTWLAPVQAVVLPISEKQTDYAKRVLGELRKHKVRATLDIDESVNYRIRQSELKKIPYMLVVGEREQETDTVAVRSYAEGRLGEKSLNDTVSLIIERAKQRVLDVKVKALPPSPATESAIKQTQAY